MRNRLGIDLAGDWPLRFVQCLIAVLGHLNAVSEAKFEGLVFSVRENRQTAANASTESVSSNSASGKNNISPYNKTIPPPTKINSNSGSKR